jgi:hypothetical protein
VAEFPNGILKQGTWMGRDSPPEPPLVYYQIRLLKLNPENPSRR